MTKKKISTIIGVLLLAASVLGSVQWTARHRYLTKGWEDRFPDIVYDTALVDEDNPHLPSLDAACANVAFERYTASERATVLEWIADGGFRWIRQKFSWAEIEAEPGKYDWTAADDLIDTLADYDLGVLAVLDELPSWAESPPDAQRFADFAGAFAKRYASRITYYQIWHNANLKDGWGGNPDAYAYAELLAMASQVIRQEDADARIVLGSLAPNVEQGAENYAEDLFLDMLYIAGAGPYFDIVSVQPYGFTTSPEDRRVSRDVMNFSRAQLVRQVLTRHGDGVKAVFASHYGWNSLPDEWPDTPSIWGSVDEQTQSEYTSAALVRASREWPWMGLMCVNHLQPRLPDHGLKTPDAEEHWGFALIGPDGRLRPVYKAIQQWTAQNTGARSGYYPANTPYAAYEGNWSLGPQGADIGQSGDRVTFDFIGTGAAVTVRRGPYRAFLFAFVDGHPAPALPADREGQAYIVLYDPLAAIATVPLAENLSYGPHRVTLVAERGWGQWAIADWRVMDAPQNQRYILGLAILSGIGFLGIINLIYARAYLKTIKILQLLGSLWHKGTNLVKTLISLTAGVLYIFAAWHLLVGDGLFRRLGDHGDWLALILSTGLFYFSHWFLITLAAGIVVALLVMLRPGLGLAFVLFASPLYLHPLSLLGKSFSLTELILIPTIAGVVLRLFREKPAITLQDIWHSPKRTYGLPVVIFVLFSLLSAFNAEFIREGLREWRLAVLEPALFFGALLALKLNRREQLRMLDALVASAVMIAAVGLVQFFLLDDVITAEGGIRRLRSIYGSPNNVGLYLGRVFPLLITVGFDGLSRIASTFKNREKRNWLSLLLKHRVWYIAALIPVTLALVLSLSRGAIILGIPAAVLTLGLLAGKKWRRVTLVLVVLGMLALIPMLRLPRFSSLLDWSGGTTGFRLALWTSSLQMIKDFPILGVGPDNFLYAYRTRYVLPTAWEEFNLSHPHNVVLDFASRLGIPGLALFVWMQVVFWRESISIYKQKHGETRILLLGFIASMVNFLAHGLVDASYFVIDLAYVYMFSLAVVVWLKEWQTTSEEKHG